jgi:hypothetical protein
MTLLQVAHTANAVSVRVRVGDKSQHYSLPAGSTLSQLADLAKLECDLEDSDDTVYRYDVTRTHGDKSEKHRFKPDELKSAKGAAFVLEDGDVISFAMILIK